MVAAAIHSIVYLFTSMQGRIYNYRILRLRRKLALAQERRHYEESLLHEIGEPYDSAGIIAEELCIYEIAIQEKRI